MGRARKVTGPFLDNMGIDMLQGGGKLFAGSSGRRIGPGHFGLLDLGDGVQKWSCHYEADLDRGGASVLDIRPLLWRDGWPVAGDNVTAGTYEIESARTGTALEMAVQGSPVGGGRGRGGRGGPPGGAGRGAPPAAAGRGDGPPADGRGDAPPAAGRGDAPAGAGRGDAPAGQGRGEPGPVTPVPSQEAAQVSANWPAGAVGARMAQYMVQAQQKWALTPVPNGGGYPGSPYFKITIAGTERALAATADAELIVVPAFSGTPEQLWRVDQLTDGTYRIMPKSSPNAKAPLALSAVGSSAATLATFRPDSDRQRWVLKTP
jgi:arabinan endo-1,5-alpha-L-arabinosidase